MERNLHRLVYISSAIPELKHSQIQNLVDTSCHNNDKFQITGLLLFVEGNFLQVLEGSREHVLQLYENIKTDSRHTNVITMLSEPQRKECFPIGRWPLEPWNHPSSNRDVIITHCWTLPHYTSRMQAIRCTSSSRAFSPTTISGKYLCTGLAVITLSPKSLRTRCLSLQKFLTTSRKIRVGGCVFYTRKKTHGRHSN